MRKLPLLASLAVLVTAIFGMAPAGASAYTLIEGELQGESVALQPGDLIDLVSTDAQWNDGSTTWISCPRIETTFELEVNDPESEAATLVPTSPSFPAFKCSTKIPGATEVEFANYQLSAMRFLDDGTVEYSIEPSVTYWGFGGSTPTKTCHILGTSTATSSWENAEAGARLLFEKDLQQGWGGSCYDLELGGSFSMSYNGSPVTVSSHP